MNGEKSHKVIEQALRAVGCMEHRGACSADGVSGDGVGLMTQVPFDLLEKEMPGFDRPHAGVGQLFLPTDPAVQKKCLAILEKAAEASLFKVFGYRETPVDETVVGRIAKGTMPAFKQVIVESIEQLETRKLERGLYLLRKTVERMAREQLTAEERSNFYFCSLSGRTMVYKGMIHSGSIGLFYKDLSNPDFVTNFAIYHTRFSTNTNPRWPLAQPFRFLGHNGEINTLQGNLNWVTSRESDLKHPLFEGKESELLPLTDATFSDSANLDMLAEMMVQSGTPAEDTMMALVPEAFRNHPDLDAKYPAATDFYEYYEGLQEGWDGPALLVFSDGKHIGARLDRNGLRPARFWTTDDGMAYMASEVGVLGEDWIHENAAHIVTQGRLGPGQMILANL